MKTIFNFLLGFLLLSVVSSAQNTLYAYPEVNANSQSQQTEKHKIIRNELMKINSLEELIRIFNYEISLRITSFKMTAVRKNMELNELQSESNLITADMKAIIETAEKGSKIYFEYIKAMGDDGKTKNLSPIYVVIE